MKRFQNRFHDRAKFASYSMLVRLSAPGESTPGKAYYIQHVQSGAELRAATLDEVTQWVAAQNLRYFSDMINASSDSDSGVQEDC